MTALAGQRDLGNGLSDLWCAVGGLKCGACSTKIEKAMNAVDGVTLARVNLTTGRLRLIWETARLNPQDLLDRVTDLGFETRAIAPDMAEAREPSVLIALAVAAFGTMNVMGFSVAVWAGLVSDMGGATREMMHWLSALIALPVAAFSGRVFYLPAWTALRHGRFNMDAAISLAILTTLAGSVFETLRGGEEVYFDAAVSLILFLLVGRWLDGMIRARSRTALENLRQLVDQTTQRVGADGVARPVPVADLSVGDVVMVPPGTRLPADGVLVGSDTQVDESLISGESLPRLVGEGAPVLAGSLAVGAALRLRVTALGNDTRLAAIADLTERAEAHCGPAQQQAERFAAAYGPSVVGAALAGFALWWLVLDASLSQSLMIAVAVLIVTCPCAAGLATPAVAARAVNLAMGQGVVVKDGAALERLAQVDRLVIDKTGTLTSGLAAQTDSLAPEELAFAASMAANSTHPLAQAVAKASPQTPLPGVMEHPGLGLIAPDGSRLGSAEFTGADGAASLWLARPGATPVPIHVTETLRPGAVDMISRLQDLNPLLLSGDRPQAVESLATRTGITAWQAEVPPEGKIQVLKALNARPLMIGDGLNDAPAMAAAHVSASPSSAADITRNAADLVLTGQRMDGLATVRTLAKDARKLIAQNLTFAAAYNIITVPLALAGGLTPLLAAILMSSSSILVMLNALRLRVRP